MRYKSKNINNKEKDVVMLRDMKVLRSLTLYVTQFIISCIYIHQTMKASSSSSLHYNISLFTRFADKIHSSVVQYTFCYSFQMHFTHIGTQTHTSPHTHLNNKLVKLPELNILNKILPSALFCLCECLCVFECVP